MMSIATAYSRFRRTVVAPYWCSGNPLEWTTPEGVGIAFYAKEGRVGAFNLAWLVLQIQVPPAADVYRNAPLRWVILNAPRVLWRGRSLIDWASYATLPEWQKIVQQIPGSTPHLTGYGVTHTTLRQLIAR